jgi:predicted nuclease of predicted toxin-antitoxin system
MKFLVDRCAGRKLADWLKSKGHDVVHVAELGTDPGDAALLQEAVKDGRIVVSIDADFGTLVFRDAASHRGLVRLPDVPPAQRIAIMEQLFEKHSADLEAGAIVTVRGSRVRITRVPPA